MPLLSIQIIELIDGIFVGCSKNHCIVDGTSYWHFFNSWSEIFQAEGNDISIAHPPIHKRWFPDGCSPIEPYNGIQPLQLQLLLEHVDECLGVHLIITLHHPNLSEREKQEEEEADVGEGVEDSHALRRENRVEKCLVSP
jgi:hypothetical protein